MYKFLKSFILLVFVFLVSFSNVTLVSAMTRKTTSLYPYTIDAYDINIDVKENNELYITETIKANFHSPRHGIMREIPLKNEVRRENGTYSRNSVRIDDISVNDKFKIKNKRGSKFIQIGDANETVEGIKEYTIKYVYNLGKDPLKDKDELYFNIIGTKWDTTISNITFTVNMPKSFDTSKLGFSAGKYGTSGTLNVDYSVVGNKIIGKYTGSLKIYEGLTMRCELPEGYFVNAKVPLPKTFPLMFIIPLISLLLAYYMWNKYGRDDEVIETVEFYPPENFNSARVAYIYKSSLSLNDVNSLLIYLADKGYLKIEELEGKKKNDEDYKIIKLKDYEGNDPCENMFLAGLFKSGNEVTKDDLYDNFYKTLEKIRLDIDNSKNRNLMYEAVAFKKRSIAVFLAIVSLITTLIIPTLDYGNMHDLFQVLSVCGISLIILSSFMFGNKIPLVIKTICSLVVVVVAFFILSNSVLYYAVDANKLTLFALTFGLVATLGVCFFIKYMPKRTPVGTEIYGRVLGFKNFLETAEKEKLEALVNENPAYFYNILPFTYVFGLSSKWIKKFESITIREPDWYDSRQPFSTRHLDRFLLSTMHSSSVHVVESSSSGSSFGGGFSGGGFSGGGSGGGGGSSW